MTKDNWIHVLWKAFFYNCHSHNKVQSIEKHANFLPMRAFILRQTPKQKNPLYLSTQTSCEHVSCRRNIIDSECMYARLLASVEKQLCFRSSNKKHATSTSVHKHGPTNSNKVSLWWCLRCKLISDWPWSN